MPGGAINTGSHPKLLWPGVKATWGQIYNQHAKEYPDLYDIGDSDRAYEEMVQITPFGLAAVKTEGGSGTYDSEIQGAVQRFTHIAYSLGYIVTHEELMDNQYPIVATRRAKANAFSIQQTVETVAALIYNNPTATTYFTFGDSLALLSAVHVNATGGTFSNILSPAADLSEASLEDLTIQVMGFQDDRGNYINIMPKSLIVPRQEWYNANRILKSVLQPDTVSNNINVLKATNVFPEGIKMNHYLTDADAWFIRTNCPEGMQMLWREQPDFAQDNDFDTKNAKALTYMRFSVGGTDPRGIVGSIGA